jgi:hypothetical protein
MISSDPMTSRPAQFTDPDAVADSIIADAGREIVLALPLGLGKANHIANALFARAVADSSIHLTILTALTLEKPRPRNDLQRRFIEPVIERLFGDYPELAYAGAVRDGTLPPNIEVSEFFLMAGRWLGVDYAQRHYISANYTHVLDFVMARGVNVVAQLVARREVDGETRYSLGSNTDLTLDIAKARLRGETDITFAVQTNDEMPFMPGQGDLPAEAFTHILDSPDTQFSLFAPPKMPVRPADYAVGLHVSRLIHDGGTLQIGIGSIGDAVAQALILRHRKNAAYRETVDRLIPGGNDSRLREHTTFTQGLYGCSEMLVDSFLALIEAGVLKRDGGGAVLHAAFFLGPKEFYRKLREMPSEELSRIAMTSVAFTNSLYGDEDAKRRSRTGARFINNAMMTTLMGAAVSDGLEDGRVVSGVGGQYDFVAQAFALKDARSVITLNATREAAGDVVSNIRWSYAHITIPRHLRDVVVTEYGIADLRGRNDRDTIAAMLSIADSRFQEELLEQAKSAGKIEGSYRIPDAFRSNTPEHVAEMLRPAREQGQLPDFPFGTDFTETEQRLIPALKALKSATESRSALMRLAIRAAWPGQPSPATRDCLDRMGLDSPTNIRERLYRALLTAVLENRRPGT